MGQWNPYNQLHNLAYGLVTEAEAQTLIRDFLHDFIERLANIDEGGRGSEMVAELGLTHDDENVETFMIRNVMR